MFETLDARWGTLNTLVNMAGPTDQSTAATFAEVPEEEWDYHIDIAIKSAMRCTRAALPLIRKAGWGRVVNVSSVAARLGQQREAPYMTAKAGLNALSRNMAVALAPHGILVNTVTPGVFCTEAMRQYMEVSGATDRFDPTKGDDVWNWMRDNGRDRYAGVIGRVAMADEIAPLVLMLGSRANSYIVGANIPIDGGTDYGIA
jgi:3-oxoacyl-[acyl-carrier protein] reductase